MINKTELAALLRSVSSGLVSPEDALSQAVGFEDLGFATVDHDRAQRCGFPEVIFAQNKTTEQTLSIARSILGKSDVLLITRTPDETATALCSEWPEATHNAAARTVVIGTPLKKEDAGSVLVVAAGTSDLPVAEEALVTTTVMGCQTSLLCDVGVAGMHRLMAHRELLDAADAIIAVAGMEGALPGVITGLVRTPVIAVPTSVGYGASFGGIAALLGMLNSCASGMAVVNIDNGFGAAAMAARIVAPK